MAPAGAAAPARAGAGPGPRRRADRGELAVIGAAIPLAVATVARTVAMGAAQPRNAIAFGALIALGELLRLSLPGGREAAPVALAGGLGYALLVMVGGHPAIQPAPQVVAVAAAGMTLGALPHVLADRPAGMAGIATRLIVIAMVAFTYRPLTGLALVNGGWWPRLAVRIGLLAAAGALECLIRALIRARAVHTRPRVALWDELRVQLPLGAAVAATAILIALAARVMGLTALALFVAPLLVTQLALRRYTGISATYTETVRALARVTEVGGYVEDGHAHRVGRLAVAVGRELGLGEKELLELEYAALMHDIGQLSLRDPIPGGATVLASAADQQRIAELGAGVIASAGVLDGVAEIVRCQVRPWRGPGEPPPLGSRVIRAANAFDDMVGVSPEPSRALAALEWLRMDSGGYDPRVVEALAKVAGRRSPPRG